MTKCDLCGIEFNVEIGPGALFFSHPESGAYKGRPWIQKYHICRGCENIIMKLLGKGERGDYDAWSEIKLSGREWV